jgi:hypothetical protein
MNVHAVWFDNRDGNYEIYYKRSSDQGITWGADTRLTNSAQESRYPSISAEGQFVHLVWRDARDGNPEIYYKQSNDFGITWGADMRLTNEIGNSLLPSMAVSDPFVHIVWYDDISGNFEIYYKRSTDNGITWEQAVRLTNDPFYSIQPSITASGSDVHVVWHDNRAGESEIYYKRSTDGGITWEDDVRLTNGSGESRYACISESATALHLVWSDEHPGRWKVYYKRSTDRGESWSEDTLLNNVYGLSEFSSIASSGLLVHVIWFDSRNGNWEIYYKRSFDEGITWQDDTRLTNSPGVSWFPSIAASGNVVHAIWSDLRDMNYEIYYKRDSTGNFVGVIQTNTAETPRVYNLYQNYPNPFNPSTKIRFDVIAGNNGHSSAIRLIIYDVMGREIETLINGTMNPGTYEIQWNASKYSSGVYFYELSAGDYSSIKKLVLLK